jgi:MoaA/NifB/PqqE/SkfB family radical SAM enzyme
LAKKGKKVTYLCQVACPHCNKEVIIRKETEIIHPAEPSEKVERYFAEKGVQTKLST